MLIIQQLIYQHPNKELLFDMLQLSLQRHQKVGLIGNNGVGKSTLLQLMSGSLAPTSGTVKAEVRPYCLPQLFPLWDQQTIAQVLQVDHKLNALHRILAGEATESLFATLQEDWTLEDRCRKAMAHWELQELDFWQKVETLSGGQKTKLFLAGIHLHQPELVLMDEPSNHLDGQSRALLYDYISTTSSTLVVVSHDKKLLNLLDSIYELGKRGITVYGGNYDFYAAQKEIKREALFQNVQAQEKALRKGKEQERETMERQQKLDARGKGKQQKEGLPTISMKTFKDNAERSTARTKGVHAGKTEALSRSLADLRKELPETDKMKLGFDASFLYKGKVLIHATQLHLGYGALPLWQQPLDLLIASGDRIAIKGANGSGKSTLLKVLLGKKEPLEGSLDLAKFTSVYIDQEYSLVKGPQTVYAKAQEANTDGLQEHEVKIRLHRFLFAKDKWDTPCENLSGGEKMRLLLCCLTLLPQAPDLIAMDEPTNNLDLQNIQILTSALLDYQGTLLVISHDETFLKEIQVEKVIEIKN